MPDLLTHLVSTRAPAAFLRDRQVQAALVFGSFLPDLVTKTLYWGAWAGNDFLEPVHSLPGLLLLCYAAALFVEAPLRKAAFAALCAGALLHLGVDMIKDNLGTGSAALLYPFSTRGYEFGWIEWHDTVLLLPLDAAVLFLLAWIERRSGRVP